MNLQNDPQSFALMKFGIGQPVRRTEDPMLVRGEGCYTDDIKVTGEAYAVMVAATLAEYATTTEARLAIKPPALTFEQAAALPVAGCTAIQAVRARGDRIVFDPQAIVYHYNRPGFRNLLRRNYRWGFSAIESKAATGAARLAWVYRYPALLLIGSLPLAIASAGYIVACWLRAGCVEPLLMFPCVLAARAAYSAGLVAGGIRWMRFGPTAAEARPRWE